MKDMTTLRQKLTEKLVALQDATPEQPYSILHRLSLAKAYKELGYPDLAAGDAYKALLLVDELTEEGEYHDEALEAARADLIPEKMAEVSIGTQKEAIPTEYDDVINYARMRWSRTAYVRQKLTRLSNILEKANLSSYDILIQSLLDCGCFRSGFDYIARAMKAFPDDEVFQSYDESLTKRLKSHCERNGDNFEDMEVDDYPDKGLVRRENYPWNNYEPDRFSAECLNFLNEELADIAPRLEVRVAELPLLATTPSVNGTPSQPQYTKQLGLFAKEDIAPGETILEEKSLLTGISRLHESYCDACSMPFSELGDTTHENITCEECNEVFFCSEECHDLAQDHYHPSICGVSVDQSKVSAREAADYLYSLLLVRALALAQTQDLHPLELKELRYIWGDYHGKDLDSVWQTGPSGDLTNPFANVPQTLSFSFSSNVIMPLHVLEQMDVNIFTESHRYDTWVFNILYAKFRGTASAQQGLDGRPEISAVHPMWCLANHSCDPNVAWEWRGSMRFWTREKLVDWRGREPSKGPGLKQNEEVFGHYCDVRLPVKERREWAVGALGGNCMCTRCVWEDAAEGKQQDSQ